MPAVGSASRAAYAKDERARTSLDNLVMATQDYYTPDIAQLGIRTQHLARAHTAEAGMSGGRGRPLAPLRGVPPPRSATDQPGAGASAGARLRPTTSEGGLGLGLLRLSESERTFSAPPAAALGKAPEKLKLLKPSHVARMRRAIEAEHHTKHELDEMVKATFAEVKREREALMRKTNAELGQHRRRHQQQQDRREVKRSMREQRSWEKLKDIAHAHETAMGIVAKAARRPILSIHRTQHHRMAQQLSTLPKPNDVDAVTSAPRLLKRPLPRAGAVPTASVYWGEGGQRLDDD
jgi:hypothetical protein